MSGSMRIRSMRDIVSSGRFGELPANATGAKVLILRTCHSPLPAGISTGRAAPKR